MRRGHRTAHGVGAWALFGSIVLIIGAAYALRQDPSKAPDPVRLEAPRAAATETNGASE